MAGIDSIIEKMRRNPKGIRFKELCRVCDYYFGKERSRGTSHRIYKVPWIYPPIVNIQSFKEKAKDYQVRQVLNAIDQKDA
ncbi:hypothetical protein D1AOALGA4SA_4000 [Olavius algarvensis Delta 1 endosymbiont]|nr:hypothetical protein D1AOALGA4SA_4000 [Olavius algarvensis Delta 1 endosymbiont]